MKCTIPEISWHNRDPVLSVDIQPIHLQKNELLYRVASGGTDTHVLIWHMTIDNDTGSVNLDLAADLTRHQRAVNVVKWSTNGEYLASGDDDSAIFIWRQKNRNENINILEQVNEQDKEIWITMKILRGHTEDIYDLCWCPNSQYLISGSVDNTAIIWDIQKGKLLYILKDHKGFVQGVAWDPLNQYVATLSTDRYLRIFDIQTKKVVSRISKCTLPVPEGDELHGKTLRIYHDDTLQTFFRRLCFSPDGKLIFTPAGVTDYDGCVKPTHTTYIYSRYSLKQPAIILPSPDQYTVAVKCCPLLFKLRPHTEDNKPVIPLPYRMIFAIATKSSVYLYDTQQRMPFALISNIHYTRLTDLTWSKDGKVLIVSSTDGFCSIIMFSENELGELYDEENQSASKDKDFKTKTDNLENNEKENKLPYKNENVENKIPSKTNSPIQNKQDQDDNIRPTSPLTMVTTKIKPEAKLILDKDIISTAEKFETPEKIDKPATPISVRRHPRNMNNSPSSSSTLEGIKTINLNIEKEKQNENEIGSKKDENQITKTSPKKATPIQIRRKPRTLLKPNPVEVGIVEEAAIDSWPSNKIISEEIPNTTAAIEKTPKQESDCMIVEIDDKKDNKHKKTSEEKSSADTIEKITSIINDQTETGDIHLFYEETQSQDKTKSK